MLWTGRDASATVQAQCGCGVRLLPAGLDSPTQQRPEDYTIQRMFAMLFCVLGVYVCSGFKIPYFVGGCGWYFCKECVLCFP